MFDARIYRAAFVPLLFALVLVGFSFGGRPTGRSSTLAPDAFDGARAFASLQALARRFPQRTPGGPGDERLAEYVAQTLRGLGGAGAHGSAGGSAGGFQVTTKRVRTRTLDGTRTLTTVIAERPGSTGESPIAIVAHRDSSARGGAAELSATAALLELARVFAQSETRRTIVLVSTSGGSAGDAPVAQFAATAPQKLDAAIVLGDLAAVADSRPMVLPFSSDARSAPESLQLTLQHAISQEAGSNPGSPSAAEQLAHLAFPLPVGEQAPLNAAGVPAVLVQPSGERGPNPGERVSESALQELGRAVLSATYALDEASDVARVGDPDLSLGHKSMPAWAIRLLALALLLPPLAISVDALARARRRRESVGRWIAWTLTCTAPPLACALFALLLGKLGLLNATVGQLSVAWLDAEGSLLPSVLLLALLALALLAWPSLPRGLGLPVRPASPAAGVAVMLVALAVALLAWIFDPAASLLLVVALHAWPLAVNGGERAPSRPLALLATVAAAIPLLLLLLVYSHELGFGLRDVVVAAALLLSVGHVGVLGTLLWSTSFGCLFAVALLASRATDDGPAMTEALQDISTRGPLSYAGPGSLGGTESALRR
jgi:hypothetical protein